MRLTNYVAAHESGPGATNSLRCEGSDAIGAKRKCRERRERSILRK